MAGGETGLFDVPLSTQFTTTEGGATYGFRFNVSDLNEVFAERLETTLSNCEKRGITMVPYTGLRDPWEQARLWRRSRTTAVVNENIKRLEEDGAVFLANALRDVGPQNGTHVTNALPGFSWHQHGEAVDCYWQKDGKPEWSDLLGYKIYAEEGERAELTAGGYWSSIQDWPHLQLRAESSPGGIYNVIEIDHLMIKAFGQSPSFNHLIY